MNFVLENLRVECIITHQIFRRNESRELVTPVYGNKLTELNTAGLSTFQERVINVLGVDSHSIEMYATRSDTASVLSISKQLLNSSDNDYIILSREIANKLAESQTARNIPGGIVIVFKGLVGVNSQRYIGIIKAETHTGFRGYLETPLKALPRKVFTYFR